MASLDLLAFFLFCLTAAITPGPNNLIIMNTGLRLGLARGLPCVAGGVVGMGILMSCAAWGLGAILFMTPGLMQILRLSWKIATAPPIKEKDSVDAVGFWRMVLFQWVNPKSWIVSASAAASYGAAQNMPQGLHALIMGATFMVASTPTGLLWLAFGVSLQRWLSRPEVARPVNIAMGVCLAATVFMVI